MQGTPCLRCWVWAIPKNSTQTGLGIYILFWTSPPPAPQNLFDLSIYSSKTRFYHCEFCKIVWHPFRVSTQYFSKVSWFSLAFWDSSSLTVPDVTQRWITRFTHFSQLYIEEVQRIFKAKIYIISKIFYSWRTFIIRLYLPLKYVFLLPMHHPLLSFSVHCPWLNLICITKKRKAFQKFCLI